MYSCPWCGRKAFSFWQKQTLGPMRTMRCPHCKRQVSLSSFRAQVVPLLAAGTVAPVIDAVVPIAEAARAYDLLASDATFGKVVLRPW